MNNKIELKNLHPAVIKFLEETGYQYFFSKEYNPVYYCNSAIIKKEDGKYYRISDMLFADEVGNHKLTDLRFGNRYFQFRNLGHYSLTDMKKAFFKERKETDFNKFLIELHKTK